MRVQNLEYIQVTCRRYRDTQCEYMYVQATCRRYRGAEVTLMCVSFVTEPVGACPERDAHIGASGLPDQSDTYYTVRIR